VLFNGFITSGNIIYAVSYTSHYPRHLKNLRPNITSIQNCKIINGKAYNKILHVNLQLTFSGLCTGYFYAIENVLSEHILSKFHFIKDIS
jgi:hypothetical protein